MKLVTYSSLREEEKDGQLFYFYKKFAEEFGETVGETGNIREFDEYYSEPGRDSLILLNNIPVAAQQYYTHGKDCYAEGIFVPKEHRRKGYAKILRTTLYEILKFNEVERFWIGKTNNYSYSGTVREMACSQGLAKRDLQRYSNAIIQVNRGENKQILGYGLDLNKV